MPEQIEFAYSNLFKHNSSDPNANKGYVSTLATLTGSMTDGPQALKANVYFKAAYKQDNPGAQDWQDRLASAINPLATDEFAAYQYDACYTHKNSENDPCDDITPITIPTDVPLAFYLPGSETYRKLVADPEDPSVYQHNPKWFEDLVGINFTKVVIADTEPKKE